MVLMGALVLLLSIAVLARSSGMVIDSAVTLSRFFQINQLAVGFLLISVATSLPEMSISVESSLAGEGGIAAGNVFGSNIANILVILGIGAFLYGIKVSHTNLKDIALVLLLTTLLSAYVIYSSWLVGRALGLAEGIALLGIFIGYAWWTLKKERRPNDTPKHNIARKKALGAFVSFVIGILLVMISSGFAVESAVALSASLGLAQSFIGATLIAMGTSLPELSTALQALRKKHFGLVLGNAVGSNMANLTLVLGVASAMNPISVQLPIFFAALLFAIVANTMLFYSAAINKGIGKAAGVIYLVAYAIYIISIFGLQAAEMGAI